MKNLLLSVILISSSLYASAQNDTALYAAHAQLIVHTLHTLRQPGPWLWRRALWWNSANIFEALLDHNRITGNSSVKLCRHIYAGNHLRFGGGFKNWAFDDEAWWALAWLKAYDQTNNPKYLHIAEGIFADMKTKAWDENCGGGGCHWMHHKPYKNAITNQLFITLAANLARRHNNDSAQRTYYLGWAVKSWRWLQQSGMLNKDNLFNDGLDGNCCNNNGWAWSYNQGVILGGLKELYLLTANPQYLQTAAAIATAAITRLNGPDSILTDPCGRGLTINSVQFKGIFIRYLSELNMVLHDKHILNFILRNEAAMWQNARSGPAAYRFDGYWNGPYKRWWGGATGVALDVENAAINQLRISSMLK